jgi:hypothetical protein
MEIVICPAKTPDSFVSFEEEPKGSFLLGKDALHISSAFAKPFFDKTVDALATIYVPGYGLYKISLLALKIIQAARTSKLALAEACATTLYPRKYIAATLVRQLGVEIPKAILFSNNFTAVGMQIFCVTITDSILPKLGINALKKASSFALHPFLKETTKISDDYILIEVQKEEEAEDDFVVV